MCISDSKIEIVTCILLNSTQGVSQGILTLRLKGFGSNFHTPKHKFL